MSHYKSNVRDIEFNLFEVLGREEILGTEPYADLDRETVSAILAEVDHLATDEARRVIRRWEASCRSSIPRRTR